MLIGYVRVSKADGSQTLEPQRDALLAGGVDPSRIYEDLASGRHDARPGLTACLKALQPGNTLVIWKLDRLGRDLRHLVITAEDLRSRGIGLKVLTGAGAQIDTTTANGRLAFGIFAAFAEFERELITERTRAGLAAARARGRLGGRPRKMDRSTLQMAMAAMSDRKAVAAEVAKRLGITKSSIYHHVSGKSELLELALSRALNALFAVTTEDRATTGRYIDRLEYLVRRSVDILCAELPYVTLLLRVRGNTDVERRALARRREFDSFVTGLVVAAAEEGDLRPGVDPALASKLVFGTVNSLIEWYRPRTGGSVEELADAVVALTFDGLRRT